MLRSVSSGAPSACRLDSLQVNQRVLIYVYIEQYLAVTHGSFQANQLYRAFFERTPVPCLACAAACRNYPEYKVVVYDALDYCATTQNLGSVKDCRNFKVKGGPEAQQPANIACQPHTMRAAARINSPSSIAPDCCASSRHADATRYLPPMGPCHANSH